MHMTSIAAVVLCGGSGTRLWPLSRKSFPKQFVPLIHGKSLLELTLARLRLLSAQVCCVAAQEQRFLVAQAMNDAQISGTMILEPAGRNTAAAMALAALHHAPDALLLYCPADHHIADDEAFAKMVLSGVSAAQAGAIVTFGVLPSFPSTAYGYIAQGALRPDGAYQVARFIEKPDAQQAQTLLLQGGVLWNAGIFLVRADTLLAALQQHAGDILESCRQAMAGAQTDTAVPGAHFIRPEASAWMACRAQSMDYAVLEQHKDVAVLPFVGAWSDVGSWNTLAELTPADDMGNRLNGQGLLQGARDTYIYAPERLVVALGTQDLVIVDTPDALLVAHRSQVEQVKQVVTELETQNKPQAAVPRKVARPWGWYDSIDRGERFQVKRICVKPGASLSLQKHQYRAEHWVVVQGVAQVTRGDEIYTLNENESTFIPIGQVHRLHNPGSTDLEMIEVQSGSYLSEDDIVRLDDDYGRR